MNLGGEEGYLVPSLFRFFDKLAQDHRANAVTPPLLEHGHSADVRVRQQPAGAYGGYRIRGSAIVVGERVNAKRVLLVELDRPRHALLFDENPEADPARLLASAFPRQQLDSDHGTKSIIAA